MEDIEYIRNEFWAKFIVIALHIMCNNTSCNAIPFYSYHSYIWYLQTLTLQESKILLESQE
jgi:hypothetical protein